MRRYVGMDLGVRTKHRAVVLDGTERRGKPFSVEVSQAGIERLLQRAAEGGEGPATVVMEPTGLAWLPISAIVSAAGHAVILAKPKKVSDLRRFLREHTKTDVVDAEVAARVPQMDPNGVHELRVPTAEQTTLRRLVKRRQRLIRHAADQKRRVHALMMMVNPPLMAALGDGAFSRAAVAFLRRYADPERVVRLGPKRFEKFWMKHAKGKASAERITRVFEACSQTAQLYGQLRLTDNLPFDYDEAQDELTAELDSMERAEQQAKQLDERIAELYGRLDPQRTLEQLPGIGPRIAAAIEALIGKVDRFRNGRRFASYCGLAPRKKQSGTSDPPMPITKAGQSLLKQYFYLAADVARRHDPELAAYYARRYARGDAHNRIVIALARKLALRVYAVLKRRDTAPSPSDQPAHAVSYVLRAPDGATLDKKAARQLIRDRYTRESADPKRAARERRARGRAERTTAAKSEWPSEDATSRNDDAPPLTPVARQIATNQRPHPPQGWASLHDIIRHAQEVEGLD